MSQKPRPKRINPATRPDRPKTKYALQLEEQERVRSRRISLIIGSVLGVALLIIGGGLLYSLLWIPSRPVAQVNGQTLSRSQYWQLRREDLAAQITQNLQLLTLFGGQEFAAQFQGQVPALNLDVQSIRDSAIDPTVVNDWENLQLLRAGAEREYGISLGEGELAQALVAELGSTFLPPPVDSTDLLTPTATLDPASALTAPAAITETASISGTVAATQTPAPTATLEPTITITPGGPTLTPEPTLTTAPTSTPEPTPVVEVAVSQTEQILDRLYNRYTLEIETAGQRPQLEREDFRNGLYTRYLRQLLEQQIKERLVSAENFAYDTTPTRYQVRHILIDVPQDTAVDQLEAVFAQRLEDANDVLARLRAGEDFATLAAEVSGDPGSKDSGGELGIMNQDGSTEGGSSFVPEFVAGVLALDGDQISEPVRTQFGWHLIQVTERLSTPEEQQLSTARDAAYTTWLEQQRSNAQIQRFPSSTPTASPLPTAVPVPTAPAATTAPITNTNVLTP